MTTRNVSPAVTDQHGSAPRPRTRALLLAGAAAGPLFYLSAIAQIATRPGFDLRRHPISQLALGDWGWIQVATFVLAGLGLVCLAIGHRRVVKTGMGRRAIPVLVAISGFGFIAAGTFRQDAAYGFPLGTADAPSPGTSWHAAVHMAAAILAFTALAVVALIALARAIRARRALAATGNGVVALALLLPVVPEIAAIQVAVTGLFAFGWCSVTAERLLTRSVA